LLKYDILTLLPQAQIVSGRFWIVSGRDCFDTVLGLAVCLAAATAPCTLLDVIP
jgi:hypothetical protein